MIPENDNRTKDEEQRHAEAGLDAALAATFPASDPINLRQWNEMEASAAARAAKQKREKAGDRLDRVTSYKRGPTAFSA